MIYQSKPATQSRPTIVRRALLLSSLFLPLSLHGTYQELLYSNDFAGDVAGEKPDGFDILLPSGPNTGAEDPSPSWHISDGPVGSLIVGDSSSPIRSLPGAGNQSLRLYDYVSQDGDVRAYAGKNFVVDSINNRFDARFDLRFERSFAMEPFESGDRLVIALGPYAGGQSFNQNANRAVQVTLTNEGEWTAHGAQPDGSEDSLTGNYDGDGVNDLSIVANAHPEDDLTYDGLLGEHTLSPYTYSLYLNGARVADGIGFNQNLPLGKAGFITGFGGTHAEIDFVVDDLAVYGLREFELREFELGLDNDFEDQTVGEAPSGFVRADPGTSSGSTEPVPLTSASDGPIGNIIVDGESSPVPSIVGKSVRLYDYSTSGQTRLSQNFIPEGEDPVAQIRFDFTFRRSVAIADGNWGQGMIVGLGETNTGLSLHQNSNRALNIRITNDGRFRVVGTSFGPDTQIEDFDELGTHEVSVFANVQDEPVTYQGPDDGIHELSGHSFSVFLNGVLSDNNNGLRNNLPALGKFGFITGQGGSQSDVDFVIDDIRVTDFSGPVELPDLPPLRIARGESVGQINLSWDSSSDVTYGVQHSPDLLEWTSLEATFMGDGSPLNHTVNMDDANRGFYRLISPVDFVEAGTAADFVSTQNLRKWATHDEEPDLIGAYDYRDGQSGQIGKAGPSQESRTLNSIHGFQLPTLEHDFEKAIYTITKTGANGSPDGWSAQVYIFNPHVTPETEAPEDVFWSDSAEDSSTLLRTLDLEAFDVTTFNGEVTLTLTSEHLAGFYNPDGTPASADGMIWFRVNPGQPADDISNFERLEIQSDLDREDSPRLRILEAD